MLSYAVRRIALTIPVLLGVATLVFLLIHMVPGDPAQAMLGDSAGGTDVQELRAKLGLDQPLAVQYERYLRGLVAGDLGTSFRYQTPVAHEIGQRLTPTAELAVAAVVVSIVIALPLGVLGALFRGRAIDHGVRRRRWSSHALRAACTAGCSDTSATGTSHHDSQPGTPRSGSTRA